MPLEQRTVTTSSVARRGGIVQELKLLHHGRAACGSRADQQTTAGVLRQFRGRQPATPVRHRIHYLIKAATPFAHHDKMLHLQMHRAGHRKLGQVLQKNRVNLQPGLLADRHQFRCCEPVQ